MNYTQTLKSFVEFGETLIGAQDDDQALGDAITTKLGWDGLRSLVATAARLTDTMATYPLSHVLSGYHRFRRYTPRMLKLLEIHGATVAVPLLNAVRILREGGGKEHLTTSYAPLRNGIAICELSPMMIIGFGKSVYCFIFAMLSGLVTSG